MIRFLCLGGFRRLSAMMRPAGGDPAFSRAIRRASPPAVNLFFAFLRAMNSAQMRPCHLTSVECANRQKANWTCNSIRRGAEPDEYLCVNSLPLLPDRDCPIAAAAQSNNLRESIVVHICQSDGVNY